MAISSKFVIAAILVFTQMTFAVETNYFVKKNNGSVRFFALANPSALKIDGVAPAPEGTLSVVGNETNTTIKGSFDFDLSSLDTGIEMRDSHMKENYLEVAKYPKSKLVIEPISLNGNIYKTANGKTSEFKGKLFLHGIEKPVTGSTEIVIKNDQIKVLAKIKVKSSDFNIETPSFAGITMADEVAVEVEFNLQNTKL